MYVGSVFGRDIVLVRSRTGRIIVRLGPATATTAPTMSPSPRTAALYWTDTLEGRVGHRALNGAGELPGRRALREPAPLHGGRAPVRRPGVLRRRPVRGRPRLRRPARQGLGGSGVPPFLDQLNGFDFGPDGRLYAPQPFQGRVIRLVVDTWVPEVVVHAPRLPGRGQVRLEVQLFAALQGSGTVVRINRVSHAARLVAKLQPGLDNLAFDARDHLFVWHAGNGRLWRRLPSGERRRLVKAGLVMPGGIAVRPGKDLMPFDQLWVADGWEIKRYDGRNGQFEGVLRQSFSGTASSPRRRCRPTARPDPYLVAHERRAGVGAGDRAAGRLLERLRPARQRHPFRRGPHRRRRRDAQRDQPDPRPACVRR